MWRFVILLILSFWSKHSICDSSVDQTISFMFFLFFHFSKRNSKRKAEGKTAVLLSHHSLGHSHILGQSGAWKITGLYHFRPRGGFSHSGLNSFLSSLTHFCVQWQKGFLFFSMFHILCHLLNLKSIKYKYKARKDGFYIHTIWSKITFPWREATFGLSVLLIMVYHKYLTLIVCPTWTIKNVCSVQKFLWLHILVRKKKGHLTNSVRVDLVSEECKWWTNTKKKMWLKYD